MLGMSAAELAFWLDFRGLYGFPVDRLEAVAANAGSYVGAVWGGKLGAAELIFRPRRTQPPPEVVKAWFESLTPDKFPGGVGVR